MAKVLKLKVRKILRLIPPFLEVAAGKLVRGPFCPSPHPEMSYVVWKLVRFIVNITNN